jgi:hypothetical protein
MESSLQTGPENAVIPRLPCDAGMRQVSRTFLEYLLGGANNRFAFWAPGTVKQELGGVSAPPESSSYSSSSSSSVDSAAKCFGTYVFERLRVSGAVHRTALYFLS